MNIVARKKAFTLELFVKSSLSEERTMKVSRMLEKFFTRESGMNILGEQAEVYPVQTLETAFMRHERSELYWPHVAISSEDVDMDLHAYVEKSIVGGQATTTVRGEVSFERSLPFYGQTILAVLPRQTKICRRSRPTA